MNIKIVTSPYITNSDRYFSLRWNYVIAAFSLSSKTFIYLPGQMKNVTLYAQNLTVKNLILKVTWISDVFSPYLKFLQTPWEPCYQPNNTVFTCEKCSHLILENKFRFVQYILFTKYIYRQQLPKSVLNSWEDASEICRDAGGYLPYFTSREELEEPISLLKISFDIQPVEGIFIGLSIKNDTVSFLSCVGYCSITLHVNCKIAVFFSLSRAFKYLPWQRQTQRLKPGLNK